MPNLKKKISFSFFRNTVLLLSLASSIYYLLFVGKMNIKSFIILSLVIITVVTLAYFMFRNASEGVKLVVYFALVAFFVLYALLTPSFSQSNTENEYTTSVKTFDQVTVSGINTLKESQDMWVYIGRETCPYCYEFAPKLADAIKNNENKVYYLDTESKDKQLTNFAEDYEIDSIPSFVYFKDGSIVARMDILNETTSNDIKKFIDKTSGNRAQALYEIGDRNIVANY